MENCNLYPDDMKYPDVKCVGHKQVQEEKIRAMNKSKLVLLYGDRQPYLGR
jgi:hypothetical protein